MTFQKRDIMLYLIAGKPGSGKSQAAAFIKQYYEKKGKKVVSLQYSRSVKEYAKTILGWNGCEETKPREFLNTVGVELIQDQLDPDFSLRRTLEDIDVYSYFYDVATVSDVRFIKEIEVPKAKYKRAFGIYIQNKEAEEKMDVTTRNHRTNHGLDGYTEYDFIIQNDGDLPILEEKIEKILEEVENNEY